MKNISPSVLSVSTLLYATEYVLKRENLIVVARFRRSMACKSVFCALVNFFHASPQISDGESEKDRSLSKSFRNSFQISLPSRREQKIPAWRCFSI